MTFDPKTKRYAGPCQETLAYLAILVSTETTERQTRYTSCARVPWHLIDEIRWVMSLADLDWRRAVRERVRLERIAKRQERAKREAEQARAQAAREAQEGV